jgi:dolichyl-phosphate beta-glucosyltransferase
MSKVHLSVIIPSYNEKVNLRKGVLDKIDHYLTRQKFSWEVIIVDDGSNDGSYEFSESFAKENKNFKVIKSEHCGKAGAVTKGILEANGEIRLFTDMDQATPIEEIEKMLPFFKDGYDLVIGSRKARSGSPLSRRVMSKSMIVLRKVTVGISEIEDTQCGFKMFSEASVKDLFTRLSKIHHGFSKIHGSNVTAGFDVELLLIASKLGYKIKEVPVEWLYVESRRVSPIKDSINGLLDLLEISSNRLSGKYNI